MKRPVIGIMLDHQVEETYAKYPWYALRENYIKAVAKFGANVICIPYIFEGINQYLDIIDGLIIPGGDFDIDPGFYNEVINSNTVKVNDTRSQFEFAIMNEALKNHKPILGICAGLQLLNVMKGGSLIQHIPDYVKSDIKHKQDIPKHIPSHNINIIRNTQLSNILGVDHLQVNSTHHQAIKTLGQDLKISAKSEDDIIEAIELDGIKFCMGVQWHPEYLATNEDNKLFKAFVEACNDR